MPCTNATIAIRHLTGKIYKQIPSAGLSLNNFSNLIRNTYSKNELFTFENLAQESVRQKPTFDRLLQEFGNKVIGIITVFTLTIILIIVKTLRARILKGR